MSHLADFMRLVGCLQDLTGFMFFGVLAVVSPCALFNVACVVICHMLKGVWGVFVGFCFGGSLL